MWFRPSGYTWQCLKTIQCHSLGEERQVPLATSGQSPEMLLNVLQCTALALPKSKEDSSRGKCEKLRHNSRRTLDVGEDVRRTPDVWVGVINWRGSSERKAPGDCLFLGFSVMIWLWNVCHRSHVEILGSCLVVPLWEASWCSSLRVIAQPCFQAKLLVSWLISHNKQCHVLPTLTGQALCHASPHPWWNVYLESWVQINLFRKLLPSDIWWYPQECN